MPIIKLKDGVVQGIDAREVLEGFDIRKKRISNIVPRNLFLRIAFKIVRWFCLDDKLFPSVVNWTRKWSCLWIVKMKSGEIFGPYASREYAVHIEYEFLLTKWRE